MCNIVAQREHFTLRLKPETVRRILRRAELSGRTKTALAEEYLEEGLRMAEHPGIVFRDGAAGRRPGLAGSRLDVWEVVETIHDEGGDVDAAAAYLGIAPAMVRIALDYYLDYRDDIDRWIERNERLASDAEGAWRRRHDDTLPA
jgi:uncharacterized protein (DUF433 family)